jgi:hypothetical protein
VRLEKLANPRPQPLVQDFTTHILPLGHRLRILPLLFSLLDDLFLTVLDLLLASEVFDGLGERLGEQGNDGSNVRVGVSSKADLCLERVQFNRLLVGRTRRELPHVKHM